MKEMQQTVMNGLNTDRYQVKTAATYSIYTATTVNPASGIVVTISQSGSQTASATTPTTSPLTNHVELNTKFACAIGDIITVAVTSTAPADQPPDLVKTTITLRQGL
jgi:hypothetical protein